MLEAAAVFAKPQSGLCESHLDIVGEMPGETAIIGGEEMLRRVFEEGRIEEWAPAYSEGDEGMDTDLSWTLDIDDLQENDLLFSSGNGKLPPREMIMGAIAAIRAFEPRFAAAKCGLAKSNARSAYFALPWLATWFTLASMTAGSPI